MLHQCVVRGEDNRSIYDGESEISCVLLYILFIHSRSCYGTRRCLIRVLHYRMQSGTIAKRDIEKHKCYVMFMFIITKDYYNYM